MLDIKAAWLMNCSLQIQYWHDLETLFISFTALCIWFNSPFYAKLIPDQKSNLAWIFQQHDAKDPQAVHHQWELFHTNFDAKILGNLRSYFNCKVIKDLLVAMRDMCIPPNWN